MLRSEKKQLRQHSQADEDEDEDDDHIIFPPQSKNDHFQYFIMIFFLNEKKKLLDDDEDVQDVYEWKTSLSGLNWSEFSEKLLQDSSQIFDCSSTPQSERGSN